MRKITARYLLAVPLVTVSPAREPARELRGRIQGTIVDSSGGSVPAATVTLLSTQTSVSATRPSHEVGHCIFDLSSPGTGSGLRWYGAAG